MQEKEFLRRFNRMRLERFKSAFEKVRSLNTYDRKFRHVEVKIEPRIPFEDQSVFYFLMFFVQWKEMIKSKSLPSSLHTNASHQFQYACAKSKGIRVDLFYSFFL